MLSLQLAQRSFRLQESVSRWRTPPEQLISLRPGASVACEAVSSVEALREEMKNVPASESFIRPHLRRLAAYTPIEPFEVLSKRLGRDATDIVKLDANENPYGPPPEVLKALGSMAFPNIYPDPETRRLRAALADLNNVPMENLLVHSLSLQMTWVAGYNTEVLCHLQQAKLHDLLQVGCGADELIDLLMRCCLDPGDRIVDCPPTFTMYAFDAAVNGADVITIPRLEGFRINVPGKAAYLYKCYVMHNLGPLCSCSLPCNVMPY